MTIDEAIKLIQKDIDNGYYMEGSRLEMAANLGIEALTLYQLLKASGDIQQDLLLKGETK